MDKETIKSKLKNTKYAVSEEYRNGNNTGDVLKISNGCLVNCFDNGSHNLQGKNQEEIKAIIDANVTHGKDVFVVYGHDNLAKSQLEAMLRRWGLSPLILDQLHSSGKTIIEKLEDCISKAAFGIVLATPDDIGYPKNSNTEHKKYRVRQNVVLELGMLLASKGRDKVAILLKESDDMEPPSDIQGLIYITFKDNVDDCTVRLAKEMNKHGYGLQIDQL